MSNLELAGRRLDQARAAHQRRPGPHTERDLERAEQAYEQAAKLTPTERAAAAERLERAGYFTEAYQLRHLVP